MTSRRTRAAGGRGPLARSFAFRLGAAFAVVAIAAAAITALVVNAAFGARFRSYLQQQHDAQVTAITLAAGSGYAGNGKWDLAALQALIQSAGTGTVTIRTPAGHDVWQWDGHSMSWNDQWMQGSGGHSGNSGGDGSSGGSGSGHGGCGSWDNCSSRDSSGWDMRSSWPDSAAGRGARPAAVLLAAAAASPSPAPPAGPAGLGPAQQIPVKVNGKAVGTVTLRLPAVGSLPDEVAFRGQVIGLVLAGGAAGALVSLALGTVFARRATQPVRQVTAAARAMAAGDRAARLDTGRADEFGEMSRAFNTMADAAQAEEDLRQGFAAEVAHELRTPLTILRSQVEGLRVGVLEPGPEALGSLDEEVQRMSRLVADLQILGSADAAGFTLQRAAVDLAALASETAREFGPLFEGAGITLQTGLRAAPAWADPVRAAQILANLLSNALKYTPAGGQVRLGTGAEPGWAVLTVADTGPGIAADELPHVFDRFFRGRAARAAGSGIGLTVVAELARAHGGTAQAASQAGHGTTFTIRLPQAGHTAAQRLSHGIFTAAP